MNSYYRLIKPGIVYSNVFVACAGFLYASQWHFAFTTFLAMALGMACVVASACVFNNWYDRGIDSAMARTKNRPLVSGAVAPRVALAYGAVLGIAGFTLLSFGTNALVALTAFVGWLVYVFCYTPLKHKSSMALYVGSVAGATPIVAGYAAAINRIDLTALVFFALLFVWQLPHFIAIATYRFDEYAAAGVPLSITRAPSATQKRFARKAFFASLVVLLFGPLLIAAWPLL